MTKLMSNSYWRKIRSNDDSVDLAARAYINERFGLAIAWIMQNEGDLKAHAEGRRETAETYARKTLKKWTGESDPDKAAFQVLFGNMQPEHVCTSSGPQAVFEVENMKAYRVTLSVGITECTFRIEDSLEVMERNRGQGRCVCIGLPAEQAARVITALHHFLPLGVIGDHEQHMSNRECRCPRVKVLPRWHVAALHNL